MPFLQGSMFVDLTNGSQSLCISFASATSLRQGVQGQQAQIILFLLKMCLCCLQNMTACLCGFHADTPGIKIGAVGLASIMGHVQAVNSVNSAYTCTKARSHSY